MDIRLLLALTVSSAACGGGTLASVSPVQSADYLGYQPVDPIPAVTTHVYDPGINGEAEVYWAALKDSEARRVLLPLQSAQVAVRKTEASGAVGYLGSSVSGESGSYEVVMDYMKFRVEDIHDGSGRMLGSGRIGVGLRIKARVETTQAGLNLGSLSTLGLEASRNNLTGGISVDIIGIDSKDVTNLIPLTSEINQTSIQAALQALASIKAKMWETDVAITPHLVAVRQAAPNSEAAIRARISSYQESAAGVALRAAWMPDGATIDVENQRAIVTWMSGAGLTTRPGDLTRFMYASEFEALRLKAVADLGLMDTNQQGAD